MTEYCASCGYDATHAIHESEAEPIFLCDNCVVAYEWGQASPKAWIETVEDYYGDNYEEDNDSDDDEEEEEYDERDHPEEHIEFVWDFSEEDK